MLLVGIIGVVVAGLLIQNRLNQVDWAVLYANVDDTTASDVLAGLDAKGIPYKVEGNGTRILVPQEQLATTRVALAGDGITASPTPAGFDEIFSQQGLASSDFEQRVNYQRALEGELARTLLAMEPVAGARVQLSIPEPSLFVGTSSGPAKTPSASVMLELRRDLSSAEADTVANIVASAVQGLSTDQVTIATSDGKLLRSPSSGGASGTGNAEKNLQYQSTYESSLAERLTELTRSLTGSAEATVQVRAVIDFTQSSTESDKIVAGSNVETATRNVKETWSGSGASAAGSAGVDGGPLNAAGTDGTYEKTDDVVTYIPGDRTITKTSSTTPTVESLHLAVVVPVDDTAAAAGTPAPSEEKIKQVITAAAGLDAATDTIEVAVVPAVATDNGGLVTDPSTPGVTAPTGNATQLPLDLLVVAAVGGAVLMLLLSMIGRRKRRQARKAEKAMAKAAKRSRKKGEPLPTEIIPGLPVAPLPADPEREAAEEIRRDLERLVGESPESLAALLSTWMAK
jgi:flagellar M-ring protein FliF